MDHTVSLHKYRSKSTKYKKKLYDLTKHIHDGGAQSAQSALFYCIGIECEFQIVLDIQSVKDNFPNLKDINGPIYVPLEPNSLRNPLLDFLTPIQDQYSLANIQILDGDKCTYESNPRKYEVKNIDCAKNIVDSITEIETYKTSVFETFKQKLPEIAEFIVKVDDRSSYPYYVNTHDGTVKETDEASEIDIGSYHINITLPHEPTADPGKLQSLQQTHIKLMKALQLLEPLFLAVYTTGSYNTFNDNHTSNESSFRLMHKWSNFLNTPNLNEFYSENNKNNDRYSPQTSVLKQYIFNKIDPTNKDEQWIDWDERLIHNDFRYNKYLVETMRNKYTTEILQESVKMLSAVLELLEQKLGSYSDPGIGKIKSLLTTHTTVIERTPGDRYTYYTYMDDITENKDINNIISNDLNMYGNEFNEMNANIKSIKHKLDTFFFGFEFRFFDLFPTEHLDPLLHFIFILADYIDDNQKLFNCEPLEILYNDDTNDDDNKKIRDFIVEICKEGWNVKSNKKYINVLNKYLMKNDVKITYDENETCFDLLQNIFTTIKGKIQFDDSKYIKHVTTKEKFENTNDIANINMMSYNKLLELQMKNDDKAKNIYESVITSNITSGLIPLNNPSNEFGTQNEDYGDIEAMVKSRN